MNMGIIARLHEASANQSAICNIPVADVRAALEALICLEDLTSQIAVGRLTDELGHDFRLNDAFMRAVELLAQFEGDSGERWSATNFAAGSAIAAGACAAHAARLRASDLRASAARVCVSPNSVKR